MTEFCAPGKIMLTGEYAVLQGATALAFPTKFGQKMQVTPVNSGLYWLSKDPNGEWFSARWDGQEKLVTSSDQDIANALHRLLCTARNLNPSFQPFQYKVECMLEFPLNWGLGSSSTLIALIAQWANIDALDLFKKSWKGSGYDVAVAMTKSQIAYKIVEQKPEWHSVSFSPPNPDEWFFVHQNKKQSTYSEIDRIKNKRISSEMILKLDAINQVILNKPNSLELIDALHKHEQIISAFIEKPMLSKQLNTTLFTKSLGAWGGDFFLTQTHNTQIIKDLGFKTFFSWKEFVLY